LDPGETNGRSKGGIALESPPSASAERPWIEAFASEFDRATCSTSASQGRATRCGSASAEPGNAVSPTGTACPEVPRSSTHGQRREVRKRPCSAEHHAATGRIEPFQPGASASAATKGRGHPGFSAEASDSAAIPAALRLQPSRAAFAWPCASPTARAGCSDAATADDRAGSSYVSPWKASSVSPASCIQRCSSTTPASFQQCAATKGDHQGNADAADARSGPHSECSATSARTKRRPPGSPSAVCAFRSASAAFQQRAAAAIKQRSASTAVPGQNISCASDGTRAAAAPEKCCESYGLCRRATTTAVF
jgi:hypothetical protein